MWLSTIIYVFLFLLTLTTISMTLVVVDDFRKGKWRLSPEDQLKQLMAVSKTKGGHAGIKWAKESQILYNGALKTANLSNLDLSYANLARANLSEVDLSGANLRFADLSGGNLRRANLSDANLFGANLGQSNLTNAVISDEQLMLTNRLRKATLPSGKKYDGRFLLAGDLISMEQQNIPQTPQAIAEFYGVEEHEYLEGREWRKKQVASKQMFLDPQHRAIVRASEAMYHVLQMRLQGRSHRDIATALNMDLQTVDSIWSAGMKYAFQKI